jgi:hypothetical protein
MAGAIKESYLAATSENETSVSPKQTFPRSFEIKRLEICSRYKLWDLCIDQHSLKHDEPTTRKATVYGMIKWQRRCIFTVPISQRTCRIKVVYLF